MAAEQNMEENMEDFMEEPDIMDEQNLDEQSIMEELTNKLTLNDSLNDPEPPDSMINEENAQACARPEQNWPMQERCVHGEINDICVPLDISEVYFRIDEPYEMEPFSKYYFREWSEVEHLFMPAIEFAEEMFGDWSPCSSPSPSGMGL